MPIGTWRNGIGYNNSAAVASSMYVMPSAGQLDNTRFSLFYVPTSGVFTVEYNMGFYNDGTIQEAIFRYDNLEQLGAQIINQNWASPATGLRQITGCNMDAGLYAISLRSSGTASNSVYGLATGASACTSIDFSMYINTFKTNTATSQTQWGNWCLYMLDNSTNPETQATYNGNIADFTPYQNCVASNKYLFPDFQTPFYKIRIKRTG